MGESVLAHLPEVGKGSGNPPPKVADRWTSALWLGQSELTDEHLVRTDEGVVNARSVRRIAEHSWSEEKTSSSCRNNSETSRIVHPSCSWPSCSSTCTTRSAWRREGGTLREARGRRRNARRATRHGDDAWSFQPNQSTSVKKRLTTKSSTEKRREANSHVCRRACQTKTDGENRDGEGRLPHASGERGFVSVEHGEHTPQR